MWTCGKWRKSGMGSGGPGNWEPLNTGPELYDTMYFYTQHIKQQWTGWYCKYICWMDGWTDRGMGGWTRITFTYTISCWFIYVPPPFGSPEASWGHLCISSMEHGRARSKPSGTERGRYWKPGMCSCYLRMRSLGSDLLTVGVRVREGLSCWADGVEAK